MTPKPTIALLTALPKEFAAARAMLDEPRLWFSERKQGSRRYCLGRIPSADGGCHEVVLSMLTDMGNNNASIRASKLFADFPDIRHLVMCGIAGGVPRPDDPVHHVRLGDVVVSNRNGVIQFDNIKLTDSGAELRAPPRPPAAEILEAARHLEADALAGERPWEAEMVRGRAIDGVARPSDDVDATGNLYVHPPRPDRSGSIKVFSSPIASSNTLLKDETTRNALFLKHGVKAVEMEGSGIADAAWEHEIGYFVVRGICDYCDKNKGDVWQAYAALAAAAYTRALIRSIATVRA